MFIKNSNQFYAFTAKKSKGEFIAFLDSDDLWHKNKLKVQIEYMFEDAEYQDQTIPLPERFSLTLCSDGVLDCLQGATLKEKEARLPVLIAEQDGRMQGIMASLGLGPDKTMPDDISVLVLSRNAE